MGRCSAYNDKWNDPTIPFSLYVFLSHSYNLLGVPLTVRNSSLNTIQTELCFINLTVALSLMVV